MSNNRNHKDKIAKMNANKVANYLTRLMLEGKYEEMDEVARMASRKTDSDIPAKTVKNIYHRDFCERDTFSYQWRS